MVCYYRTCSKILASCNESTMIANLLRPNPLFQDRRFLQAFIVLSGKNWQESKGVSIERSSFCIEPLIFTFKGNLLFNRKKQLQRLKPKLCDLSIPDELETGSQFPLSANRGKPISATNHRTEMRENYKPSMWMGFPLSVLCSGRPMDRNDPHIFG